MKKIGLFVIAFFFLFLGFASAALMEGTWNTNQIGAMPGGDTLKNGVYHADWYGVWPEGIDSEIVWKSMGDNGAQWTIQGIRTWAAEGSGWWAVEGTDTYYYQPIEATYVGNGQLMFDGNLYPGSGWTQDSTYTNKYLYYNAVFYYVGSVNMTVYGYGVFANEPFEINFTLIPQQDTFNLDEAWDEGHSTYGEITISSIPIPVTVSPSSQDYGIISIDCNPAQTFTLENVSSEDFVLGTLILTGDSISEFKIQNDTCSGLTLSPSGTCTFDVALDPELLGSKSAAVNIPYTASSNGGVDVPLSGNVTEICECNLNTDNTCDMQDWLLFGQDWGRTDCNDSGVDCECDLNTDGRCDMQDWLLFGQDWGRTDCPVCPWQTLFFDNFNRPDAPLGANWTVIPYDGSFDINGNRAYPQQGDDHSPMAYYNSSISDDHIRVSVNLVASGGDYPGEAVLFLRSTNPNDSDCYACGFSSEVNPGELMLIKIEGGILTILDKDGSNILLPDGSLSTLTFEINGSDLTCTLSGAANATVTGTDSTFTSGYTGMLGGDRSSNYLYYDDFKVEKCE